MRIAFSFRCLTFADFRFRLRPLIFATMPYHYNISPDTVIDTYVTMSAILCYFLRHIITRRRLPPSRAIDMLIDFSTP